MNGKHVMIPASKQEYRISVNPKPKGDNSVPWIVYRGSYAFACAVYAAWTKKGHETTGVYSIPMGD